MDSKSPPPYSTLDPSASGTQPPKQQTIGIEEDEISARNAPASTALSLPIVIPQTSKSFRGAFFSPFVRAYVPELAAHGVSQEDFLTWIDGLNEVFVGHPIFQYASIAGGILGSFYGMNSVEYVGMGLQVGAGLASAATSYARTKAYHKATQQKFFHPAGLHCNIFTTKKMMAKLGRPEEKLSLPKIETWADIEAEAEAAKSDKRRQKERRKREKRERKKKKRQSKRDSSSSSDDSSSSDSSSSDSSSSDDSDSDSSSGYEQVRTGSASSNRSIMDPRLRRIQALKGYVMPLDLDVPKATEPDNFFRKMGARQAEKLDTKQNKKMEKKRAKGLRKVARHHRTVSRAEEHIDARNERMQNQINEMEAKLDSNLAFKSENEQAKMIKDFEKDKSALERQTSKGLKKKQKKLDKATRKRDKKYDKLEKKDTKTANKIRWVVISVWDGKEGKDNGMDEDSDYESLEQDLPPADSGP